MKKRIKAIESHVEADDYFGTLATLLNLLPQAKMKKSEKDQMLKDLTGDLVYLQKNFQIVRRKK